MSIRTRQIMGKLHAMADSDIAAHSQRFFKTGKGEYGEGDRFLGIRVPALRTYAREFRDLPLEESLELLKSAYHEARQLALLILVARYAAANRAGEQAKIYRGYLGHTKYINNWDLVDCSAEHIVGAYLFNRNRKPIYRLARSTCLWERRIAVVSTFYFIKRNDFTDTLAIAESFLSDREDLIHKAVGWMLREVGKRNRHSADGFLAKHYRHMPRTTLRYAVEKLPESERQGYLRGTR
jgi:3-methyladenine DNA glycosylase AlkD